MNSFSQLSSSVSCRIDKGFRALGKSNLEIPELVYDQAKFLVLFTCFSIRFSFDQYHGANAPSS